MFAKIWVNVTIFISSLMFLADVFENYRSSFQKHDGLDPVWYISGPQLAFDSCLKFSNVKLQFITDLGIYNFLKNKLEAALRTYLNGLPDQIIYITQIMTLIWQPR